MFQCFPNNYKLLLVIARSDQQQALMAFPVSELASTGWLAPRPPSHCFNVWQKEVPPFGRD